MSYEKKIKDLMGRLVSMSPEPPPFPEETQMVRPETRRPTRPALAFAAAAALVALLAVPLLLFTGEEEPLGGGSTTSTSTTSTTLPATSTTVSVTSSTTEPVTTTTEQMMPVAWAGVVFLHQEPVDSFMGNPALVPVQIEVRSVSDQLTTDDAFTEALTTIGEDLPDGFSNSIPAEVSVSSLRTEGNTIVADMNEAFLAGAGGLLADMTMLNQIIYSLTWMNEEASVLFTVNDEPVEAFGSDGLVLTDPVDRESFRDDHLHVINLTTPIVQQDDGTYLVEGIANVFEATVTIAVLDGGGAVVDERFVTATCGTGCWGEFSTEIDPDLIVPGQSSIRVFQHSAEDGSVVDAITVPIPEGVVWQFTVRG